MAPASNERSEQVVAAFDLDGTLTHGGSVLHWLAAVTGVTATAQAAAVMAPRLGLAGVSGGSRADTTKEDLFAALLQGRPLEEVATTSASFAEHHVATKLRTDTKARLDWHLAMGHAVVLVSASPELYVSRVAELVGAHGAVATRLAVDQTGTLSGRYEGKNCRGAEKVSRLTAWMHRHGLGATSGQPVELWAYGNSRGDLGLLRAADRPVSCAKLGRLSKLAHFSTLADVVAQREQPRPL